MSRSNVLPEPWGPMTPAVRSQGTHSCPPRGSCASPRRHPTWVGSNGARRFLPGVVVVVVGVIGGLRWSWWGAGRVG